MVDQHRYAYKDWDTDSQLIDLSIRDAGCFTLVSPNSGWMQVYPKGKCPGIVGRQLAMNNKALAMRLCMDLIHEAGYQPVGKEED